MNLSAAKGQSVASEVEVGLVEPKPLTPQRSAEPQQPAVARWYRSRWVVPALILVGFILNIAWRQWLTRHVNTPVAHADEDRYLLSARALAGGPGGLAGDTSAFRRMGYPLLLMPIYWYTTNAFKVYHLAQLLGAIVNATAFPLAYLFTRRVLHAARPLALGLAFVSASLPALVYYSEFTLTDVLFAPIGLSWLLLLHGWQVNHTPLRRTAAAIGAGAIAGYAFVVHVRGAIILAVFLATLAYLVYRNRTAWKVAVASAVTALAMTSLDVITQHAVGDKLVTGGTEPNNILLTRLTEDIAFVHTLANALGQFWYLTIGTWGLAAIGLLVAYDRTVRSRSTTDQPQRLILTVALVTTIAIALSSAAALPDDSRVSNHAYVRYIAFLAPVWVTLAGATLANSGRWNAIRLLTRATVFLGAGLFIVLSQMRNREYFEPFDTPEVSFLTGDYHHFNPVRASAIVLAVTVLIGLAMAWPRHRLRYPLIGALVAALALNAVTMTTINRRLIIPMAQAQYAAGAELLKDVKIDENDIVVCAESVGLSGKLNAQREIYWAPLPEFNHLTGQTPPTNATVVIAPWHSRHNDDWDGTTTGWRRAFGDPQQEYAVWLRAEDPRLYGAGLKRKGFQPS